MTKLHIQKPTLLLDPVKVQANIDKMAAKARQSGVRFRPHFKTHQSAQVGEWFRVRGLEAITVSSVSMAAYFARHGWQDITVAFPVNILEIEHINWLAQQVKLGLLVESAQVVQFLAEHLTASAQVWVKVDTGYHRTGIAWTAPEACVALAQAIEAVPQLSFKGLLTHSGHTYAARSQVQVEAIYRETVLRMKHVQERLAAAGLGQAEISIGDTPSCSLVDDLSAVDEIRPGNFVFYDVMQLEIGSCTEAEIGVAVACPIVAKHPERNELVVYGGAVHLSKEFIEVNGTRIFGYVALLEHEGWGPSLKQAYVSGISQEHGLIKVDNDTLDRLNIGDIVAILPVHSCLTVDLLRDYLTTTGEASIR
ncbi:MAG: alanine racemase [Chloroflexales bacterium]|nr:alanine racemase [Chloroflexales bacterium]